MSQMWIRSFESLKFVLLRPDDYSKFKRVLNKGKHPTFIGKDMFRNCALNGGAFIWSNEETDVATALINARRSVLLVLNVIPDYRGGGIGQRIVEYLRPNFVRALESRVPFFTRMGYIAIGELKRGRSLNTQVMIRDRLIDLSGRLRNVLGGKCRCSELKRQKSESKTDECPVHVGVTAENLDSTLSR